MKKAILGFSALFLIVFGCKKSSDPAPEPLPYMSKTTNSTWQYETTNNTTSVTTNYTLTSTNRDTTVNGRTYHVYTNSQGNASEYYSVVGNDYYQYRDLPPALGGGKIEALYLKDNAAVGISWNQILNITVSGVVLPITITYTITEKNTSKTVNAINYTEVIGVKTSIAINNPLIPPTALVTDINNFYARKVGLIQGNNKVSFNFSGFSSSTDNQTKLKSSDIK